MSLLLFVTVLTVSALTPVSSANHTNWDRQRTTVVQVDRFEITPAIFVGARPVLTNRFGLRFQAMVLNGVNVKADFELLQNATVVRNGQPARLFDLRAGDQLLIYQPKLESPEVIRVEASSP